MQGNCVAPISHSDSSLHFPNLSFEDYQQIMAVIAAYGRLYDDDRIDDFINLLAPDAVYYPNWPGVAPESILGTDRLRRFFSDARANASTQGMRPRHYATNILFTEADADRIGATVGMLYAESDRNANCTLKMIGQYDYVFEKQDGRWRIAQWSMRYDKPVPSDPSAI